jgi:putative tricarboxylic transport membrane protein
MKRLKSDQIVGALLVLLGALVALEARTFTVGFLADPLGPRAVPYLVAAFLVAPGGWLTYRPRFTSNWPPAVVWCNIALALATLVTYALLLRWLGFLLLTTLAITALSLVFGGRIWRSLLSAAAFTAALYVLFVYLLDLTLPVGALFLVSG